MTHDLSHEQLDKIKLDEPQKLILRKAADVLDVVNKQIAGGFVFDSCDQYYIQAADIGQALRAIANAEGKPLV